MDPSHLLRRVVLGTDPDGEACYRIVTVNLGRPVTDLDQAAADAAFGYLMVPPCPGQDPAVVPELIAQEVVRRISLPVPDPRIEPGRMLVGLTAYLEAGPDLTHVHHEPTPLGEIEVVATARVLVDWGDGTVTEHDSMGGPHPDGDVTHVYRHPGRHDLVITYTWVARWTVAGRTGTIDTGLVTTGTIPDFEVEERQAVITRNG